MDLSRFGKNIQLVREDIFKLTQKEFAVEVGSTQVLISRMERGIGGEIRKVFEILNYYRNRGYNPEVLFESSFSIKKFVKKRKQEEFNVDINEFGRRVRIFREEILNVSQDEYGKEINAVAGMISRLETGIGGNIEILFDVVNSANRRNLKGSLFFADEFDVMLMKNTGNNNIFLKNEDVVWILKDLQRSFNEKIDKLISTYNT